MYGWISCIWASVDLSVILLSNLVTMRGPNNGRFKIKWTNFDIYVFIGENQIRTVITITKGKNKKRPIIVHNILHREQ